ncbi:hypothetical protein HDR58_10715 [bacterium]|nr:hypothetical protein [bacterium]
MKLMIGPNIDNSKVRLDFRKSPDMPENTPSYTIENSKADEFVLKYNSQTEKLNKIAAWIMTGFTLASLLAAIKISLSNSKHKLIKIISVSAGSLLSGGILSVIIASNKNNKLMDKYKVSTYPK